MTKEELLHRAGEWLKLPSPKNRMTANIQELNTLFNAATGRNVDCTSCNFNAMAAELQRYVLSPDSLTVHPTKKEIMATKATKYKVSKAALQNGTDLVVLNHGGTSEAIRLSEMTDAQAERIAKNKRFAHNVELVKTTEAKADAPKATAKKASTSKAAPAAKEPAPAAETKADSTDKE